MYDFRDINKLLQNVENIIPQIVGAIVALTALIGTIAGLAQNGSSVNPNNGGNSVVGNAPSDNTGSNPNLNPTPKLAKEKLLIPDGRKGIEYRNFDQGVEVKFGDKVFTDSARAKHTYTDTNITRFLDKEFRRATFTAVWDENVLNEKKEETVRIYVNGNLTQSKIVQKGTNVDFDVPVANIDTLKIAVDDYSGGLSIVNGVLYR